MTPEGFVLIALFFLATGGIALVSYICEKLGWDDRLSSWVERRIR